MKTNYTVIAYRPEGADYSRGCLMGSSSSDMQIEFFENHWTAAETVARFEMFKKTDADAIKNPRDYAEYEITVLLNGIKEDDFEWEGPDHNEIESEFINFHIRVAEERDRIERVNQKKISAAQADAERKARKAEEDAEASERLLLERLMAKYLKDN